MKKLYDKLYSKLYIITKDVEMADKIVDYIKLHDTELVDKIVENMCNRRAFTVRSIIFQGKKIKTEIIKI